MLPSPTPLPNPAPLPNTSSQLHRNPHSHQSLQSLTSSTPTAAPSPAAHRRAPKANARIFGVLLLLTQVALGVVYSLFVVTPPGDTAYIFFISIASATRVRVELTEVILNIFMSVLVILGFGLLLAYNKKMLWSALGYQLLITCLTVQLYFIVNNLLARSQLLTQSLRTFTSYWHLNLWAYQRHFTEPYVPFISPRTQILPYGNTLYHGLQCALANCIAYASVLGRVGLLQLFFVTVSGTVGYELCRLLIQGRGVDIGQTGGIFVYGGFYGLVVGVVVDLVCRRWRGAVTKCHELYTGSLTSVGMSLMGAVIVFTFMPVAAMHPPSNTIAIFRGYLNTVTTLYYSLSASAVISLGLSLSINAKPTIRDLINGTIAGGIAGLGCCYTITSPVYAMIVGATAGLLQVAVQNLIQKPWSCKNSIIHTHSFTLFGIQGLLGLIFASIYRQYLLFTYNGQQPINRTLYPQQSQHIVLGLLAAGIGCGVGVVVGVVVAWMSQLRREECFCDWVWWGDGGEWGFMEGEEVRMARDEAMRRYRPGLLAYL